MINFATPLSQIGTGRTSSGNYNQKFILNSQGQKVMTDDTTRPIGQDAMGRKIVGARSMSGMAGLGGVTNVPNAAAPGYGGYRGTMQGSHIDANTTPGGVTPDYGPIGESYGPLSPDYGDGALGQIKAGSAMSSMGVDLAGSRANSQAESARRQNEQWKGTPYYQPPFGGFRRKGGPMQRGQAYVVGENGPELVVPNQSGTVIPAGATERIMRPRSAFDKMYARKAIDPLTNMSYAPSSTEINRKRRELQQMGDMEALAEFDNLIQSRSSGNPYAQSSAEDSFRRFRAARQYAGKMVTPQRQPEFTNQQPTTMPQQDVAPPIPSYQSGTVTQTPLGRVLHGSVYGTGSSTLMPKPYAPPPEAPSSIRAPMDYSGITSGLGLNEVGAAMNSGLESGAYAPEVAAAPLGIRAPIGDQMMRENPGMAESMPSLAARIGGTLAGPPTSAMIAKPVERGPQVNLAPPSETAGGYKNALKVRPNPPKQLDWQGAAGDRALADLIRGTKNRLTVAR